MKAKLLRRFRKRYEVKPANDGKPFKIHGRLVSFVVYDHRHKRVQFLETAFDVANLCALKMQGSYSALEHEGRHRRRLHILNYFKYAGGKG